MVVFAHLADVHLGAWRDPLMRSLGLDAFESTVSKILSQNVDFVVIAGDLFHTALPGIDIVKFAVKQLQRFKTAQVPVYFVAGSHDYSPTGKTMLDVLEEAELAVNVFRPVIEDDRVRLDVTIDPSSGVGLCGVLGKAGQLDRLVYEKLEMDSSQLPSQSVFVFHAALEELRPAKKDIGVTHSVSFLPSGFSYYAGGHVHIVADASLPGYARIAYPGPLFPASFSELEELIHGGYYLVHLEDDVKVERHTVVVKKIVQVVHDVSGKDPDEVSLLLKKDFASRNVSDAIVLIRLRGELQRGGVSDIAFRSLFSSLTDQGAYACLKNTSAVRSPQLAHIETVADSSQEIERLLIAEHAPTQVFPNSSPGEQESFIAGLMALLAQEQGEETKKVYEERIVNQAEKYLRLSD